jgi:16S rRNA (cytosine967-C5)-methyltransferase
MGNRGQVFAFDNDRNRLAPIYERLKRAGVRNVQVRSPGQGTLDDLAGRMDLVLVDAPCTGRAFGGRRPDAKWRLTADSLANRMGEQDRVLAEAAAFVRPGGVLAYATCSLLPLENGERISGFLAGHPEFRMVPIREAWTAAIAESEAPTAALSEACLLLTPRRTGTDGFFLVLLRRSS